MIADHQPTVFGDGLVAAFSSRTDGTMLVRSAGRHAPEAVANRRRFLGSVGADYEQMVYQVISYQDSGTYECLSLVDGRHTMRHTDGVVADALITDQPGVALFLPVADCVATLLHDPVQGVLAVMHLGRHSTVTDLVWRTMVTMEACFGTDPADVCAWLSPAVQQDSYGLDYFDQADDPRWRDFAVRRDDGKIHLDLSGYNLVRLMEVGVLPEHIEVSPVDTATHRDEYFSHSRGDTEGRMALVAMMRKI